MAPVSVELSPRVLPPAPAGRFDAQRLEDAVPLKPDYPLMLGRRQAAGKTANCAEEILWS